MVCPKCQSHKMHRIRREGFLRENLAPLFGYFPWRCSVCRTEQLLRERGGQRSSQESTSQHLDAPVPPAEHLGREPVN
jgi:hypothetical protein